MGNTLKPWEVAWIVKDEITRGGQGIVTEVKHRSIESKRGVLKQILPQWINNKQAMQRLEKEGEILRDLFDLGASVPQLYDGSTTYEGSEPFLLMEYIEGIRFDKWLNTQAPVKPDKAVAITRAIAKTIQLCHDRKIGHRDLKPANVILKGGDINSPYILDFGISFDSQQTMMLTRDGETFWNEFIMLPECQDRQGGHRDLRSDITALVGVFFSCLTGKPPITLRDAMERAPQQRHRDLVLSSASTPGEGERLIWFFQRGFEYQIANRFQTMDEFLGELKPFSDTSLAAALDPLEEFRNFNRNLELHDRKVHLNDLNQTRKRILDAAAELLSQNLSGISAQKGSITRGSTSWPEAGSDLPPGDQLGTPIMVEVSRELFTKVAGVIAIAMAEGMLITFYVSGYIRPLAKTIKNGVKGKWSKAAMASPSEKDDSRLVPLIVKAMSDALAQQLRNLAISQGQPADAGPKIPSPP